MSPKTAIVYDHGLYTYLAQKLAEDYEKVYYYVAQDVPYPVSDLSEIGVGIPGIERIYDFHHLKNTVDKENTVFCFFDNYNWDLQQDLRASGFSVYGGNDKLETDRIFFREALRRLRMPVAKYVVIQGVTAVMKHLEDKTDKYIKSSYYRGDFETYHFISMNHSRGFFDDLRYRLGLRAEKIKFIIEDPIKGLEVGCDGFQLQGEMASHSTWGYEIKDGAYICKVEQTLPPIINKVNKKFQPLFAHLGYQGSYSNEIRLTDKRVPYFTDPCCRAASPPSELSCELYENFGEAIWILAHGGMPKLKPRAKYGAEIILKSGWHEKHWLHVEFPDKVSRWIKLKNVTRIDGKYHCIPNGNGGIFGAAIAIGDDPATCLKRVMKIAELVKAEELNYLEDAPAKCKEAISQGEELGLKF